MYSALQQDGGHSLGGTQSTDFDGDCGGRPGKPEAAFGISGPGSSIGGKNPGPSPSLRFRGATQETCVHSNDVMASYQTYISNNIFQGRSLNRQGTGLLTRGLRVRLPRVPLRLSGRRPRGSVA